MAGDERIHSVQYGRGVHGAEQLADWPRGAEIQKEGNAAAAIAGDGRAVSAHEPPASASLVGGNRREQAVGFLALERNESEITVAIECDGDPRRPAAELSPAVVEHHGALQRSIVGHAGRA